MEDREKVIEYLKETGVWASLKNENSSWFHIAPNTLIDLIKGYEQ